MKTGRDETGVKLVAVSIDDSRSMSKVAPYVNALPDWEYEIYLDPNSDLKRAMGVPYPHTFLLNKENKIVWQHKGYIEGDEIELYKEIKKLVK